MKKTMIFLIAMAVFTAKAQQKVLAPTPPMGFMTWNYFGVDFTENDIKTMADAMVANGLVELGYNYMFASKRDKIRNVLRCCTPYLCWLYGEFAF